MDRVLWLFSMLMVVSTNARYKVEQVHLSFGDFLDRMVVMWSTVDVVECHVTYNSSNKSRLITARSNTTMLHHGSWNALKVIHRAELTNLQLNKVYHYQVHCTDYQPSRVYNFRTVTDIQDIPAIYLVYGDLGYVDGLETIPPLLKEVQSGRYTSIWHVGDFAYDLNSDGGKVGDEFMRAIEPIAASIPYMTSPGNHELSWGLHHYRTRFSMPKVDWPMTKTNLWYSYDIGLTHFISYSTEVYFTDNQDHVCEQFNWLLQDLIEANQNRHKRPWIVAMGHRPMYCSNKYFDDCTGRFYGYWVKSGLEDLFYAQGVDLIIEAHEHSYERLWPVYDGKVLSKNYVNPRAPVHVISGAAGNKEGVNPMESPDAWSAFRADKSSSHSYGRLYIQNSTHLYFEQMLAKENRVLDYFWLVQANHGPYIMNISCSANQSVIHHSCSCPKPFRYRTVFIIGGIIMMCSLLATCTICYKRKCKKRKCKRCCCYKICYLGYSRLPTSYENMEYTGIQSNRIS